MATATATTTTTQATSPDAAATTDPGITLAPAAAATTTTTSGNTEGAAASAVQNLPADHSGDVCNSEIRLGCRNDLDNVGSQALCESYGCCWMDQLFPTIPFRRCFRRIPSNVDVSVFYAEHPYTALSDKMRTEYKIPFKTG